MAGKGGVRPGAGRPRKVIPVTNEKRFEMLKAYFGEGFEDKINKASAKDTLYACKHVAMMTGEVAEAAKYATALLPFEESKPISEQKVTIDQVRCLTDADLVKMVTMLETQEAECTPVLMDVAREDHD